MFSSGPSTVEQSLLYPGPSSASSTTHALPAQDKSMRLWDLKTNICQGILHTPGSPVASFDQQVPEVLCHEMAIY
jgi:hypothetical protein